MKWSIDRKLLFFGVGLLAVILGAGCAAHRPQVCDETVKIEISDGVRVAETTEKLGEKVFVDDKGAVEVISTPFGYVKHRIKQPEEESSTPAPAEPPVPSAPEVRVPTAQPPVSRAELTRPAPQAAQEPGKKAPIKGKGQIVFNFDDADLYEVIRTIAELLNINYIVDPNVRGKVTIHTAGGLKREDLFPVFFQILEINGLTAIKEGSLYKIVGLKDAPRMPITARFGSEGEDVLPGERVIIQIIPLKFISAQEMTKVLTPFISEGGTIISGGVSNTILVVDKGVNILKVLRLVEAFDVNVFEMFNHRFYHLEYLDAEEIVEAFTNILGSYGDIAKDIVNVIAIKRLNALLVISSNPQAFEKVELFIRQLDVPSEDVDPRIYVYSVKNGEAEDLGNVLNSVFAWEPSDKKKTTKDKSEKEAETAPSRNPFSRKTKEAKSEKVSEVQKKSVSIGKTETTGSGTLKGEIHITADKIRNALIIAAIPSDYRVIENILKQIDVLPRQVLIEVTIAEISLDESTELGIAWTYLKGPGSLGTSLLDAALGSSGFRYTIGMTDRWTSALAFLASQDKVNILSSPSVLASDNKEAKIDISTEIPVASTQYIVYESGTEPVLETTIEYRDTGVLLSVTPHINDRGLVTMDINQEVSEQSEYISIGVEDKKYPSFYKRSVNTTLTVKHAQTIVIGGLIKETKSEGSAGAPWLSKIPIIRYLFGKEKKSVSKTELIILITPYVIVSLDDVDAVTEEFKRKVGTVMKMFGE